MGKTRIHLAQNFVVKPSSSWTEERERAVLTVPGVKHVGDEVVYEGDLRLGNAAGVPVKHRHHHRQALPLLLVRLQGEQSNDNEVISA